MKFNFNPRKNLEPFWPYIIVGFIAFATADLVLLNYRDLLLPKDPPPKKIASPIEDSFMFRPAYNTAIERNIFSRTGEKLAELKATGDGTDSATPTAEEELPPVLSSLALNLVGTIVHSNPERSIANIEVKSKNQVFPYSVGREIEGLARVYAVERTRVYFKNLNNNRREYIEMKLAQVKFSLASSPVEKSVPAQPVAQVAPNKFEIKRSDLNKYLSDISNVLQQASMVPEKNPDGTIKCFKFVAIQPGSIFTQLGMQNNDCLGSVNGEPINSIPKAMEMFNALKGSSDITIGKTRDGREQESVYKIK